MDVDVNATDRGERPATALMRAAEKGHVEVVNLLLNAKADVNKRTDWGDSAVSSAAISAKSDVLRVLLDKGVSAENINHAFVVAASWGRTEALRLLLKKGADIKRVGAEALTEAVHANPYRGRSEQAMTETIGLLLDSGVDVNTRDKSNKPVLHIAANDGFLAVAKTLLDRGADINARDNEGTTALWWAAGIGQRDATILLVERGADLNAKANDGTTALWRAKYNNDRELIAFLTGRGAE
jgi:ankyrin repeat protein